MIDFHIHLARFEKPLSVSEGLLREKIGFNNIACEPWEWEKSLNLNIAGAFGIHPMIAGQVSGKDFERLVEILRSDPSFAVGECGLDRRFDGYEEGGIQERVLVGQVRLAAELSRSLQVHCVGDYSRILKVITETERQYAAKIPQVVLHRFGGDVSAVRSAIRSLGTRALFSLHADSFRKKSTVAAIKEIPPEQLRFETDADEGFVKRFGGSPDAIVQQLRDVQEKYRLLEKTAG